ncbi:18359_t:CDS:2 [Gigaspora margarita]|uniref:18359_t:CDS:1 n=1 Tax=Gigaspora margarita TaxID=4874 RepID=A0ABN7VBU4_GIGMA|nr:18359_t:CDS:2 [Gigaspora margarita]
MSAAKENSNLLGKNELVDRVFREINENGDRKMVKSQCNEVIETFLQEIKLGLKEGSSIVFKGHFSLSVVMTKEAIKVNPQNRQETISDLKRAKKLTELNQIYETVQEKEIYQKNKNHIDSTYNKCVNGLRAAGAR